MLLLADERGPGNDTLNIPLYLLFIKKSGRYNWFKQLDDPLFVDLFALDFTSGEETKALCTL